MLWRHQCYSVQSSAVSQTELVIYFMNTLSSQCALMHTNARVSPLWPGAQQSFDCSELVASVLAEALIPLKGWTNSDVKAYFISAPNVSASSA